MSYGQGYDDKFESMKKKGDRDPDKQKCAHEEMDRWEEENLLPKDMGKPRALYCTCPRCSAMCMQ